jgi:hypothetical protein
MLQAFTRPPFVTPTLDLNFVRDLALDSRITFTRASSATFFDSAGVLQTAASGAARFTYDPATLQPQGLLIEEQRTNLCLQSADFGTTWTAVNATVTTNAVVSPDGTTNADNVFETTANGEHYVRQTFTGLTANTVHTVSVFVKNLGGRNLRIRVLDTDNTANGYGITVSPNLGTVFSAATAFGAGSSVSGGISSVGNGWYRVTLSGNAGATCTKYILDFFSYDGGTAVFVGDVTKGLTLFGAQLEAGAFATSYIPTTTTALTRNADAASMTGTNFSSWYRADEGTLYAQGILVGGTAATFPYQAAFVGSNANNDSIGILWAANTGSMRFGARVGGVAQADLNAGSNKSAGSSYKVAGRYAANDFQVAVDGTLGTADTSGSLPTITALSLGGIVSFQPRASVWLQRVTYYPRPFANAQLQALTA